jgi:ubiquinone/menaquinone biosynthesis C-methylase UbiE
MPKESPGHRRFHGNPDRLRSPERLARMEVERVVALSLDALTAAKVLDVGTGTGVFAEAFSAEGAAVSAIDPNPDLLELARRYVPAADFKQAAAESIPYPDATFDMVFLGHVLHETDDPLFALQEARRVSKSRVMVLEWPRVDEDSGPPLAHRLAVETVLALAESAGFRSSEHIRLTHMDLYRLTCPS